jgi:serine protease AprX
MNELFKYTLKIALPVFLQLLISSGSRIYCQSTSYSYFYRVYFKDKGENNLTNFAAPDLLSSRAVSRRQKSGIQVPDLSDLPVNKTYVAKISGSGLILHCTSKWMNTALFKTSSAIDINNLLRLPFVLDVKIVKSPGVKSTFEDKLDFSTEPDELTPFDRPVTMIDGYPLLNSSYNGKGILIAVLDGGFSNADQISSLSSLRMRNGVKTTYNFVDNNNNVYGFHNHGTAVLSVLAGAIPDNIQGTSPGADYILLRTEDTGSEFPCEEDFWAAGAEFADSAGVDIISSSLGYYKFDNPSLNYKHSDLDGNTAFVTKAADFAASKGILVVISAGNERDKDWKRIDFPADGDSVLAVGAVDGNNFISSFSSTGPAADGRIKPDICALGVSVPVQTALNTVGRSNGTSFSCPVISGMAACLLQAVPTAKNKDIIDVLHFSSDRYNSPDSLYGYGIPDMVRALNNLQDLYVLTPAKGSIASPNPTYGAVEVYFNEPPVSLIVEIISVSGKTLLRKSYPEYAGRTINITETGSLEQGIYFIRLIRENGTDVHKIVKLKN